jgi:DHA2 family multidrug resistance protein-like MFS transporter
LSTPLRTKADESLAGALQAAGQVGGEPGARVAAGARDAYVSGMHVAAIVAASVAILASIIVYHLLPSTNAHTVAAADAAEADALVVELGPAV